MCLTDQYPKPDNAACKNRIGGFALPASRTEDDDVTGIDNEIDQALEGHLVDASALRGDEGRGTLR